MIEFKNGDTVKIKTSDLSDIGKIIYSDMIGNKLTIEHYNFLGGSKYYYCRDTATKRLGIFNSNRIIPFEELKDIEDD